MNRLVTMRTFAEFCRRIGGEIETEPALDESTCRISTDSVSSKLNLEVESGKAPVERKPVATRLAESCIASGMARHSSWPETSTVVVQHFHYYPEGRPALENPVSHSRAKLTEGISPRVGRNQPPAAPEKQIRKECSVKPDD